MREYDDNQMRRDPRRKTKDRKKHPRTNKYANLVENETQHEWDLYDPVDKTYRKLPVRISNGKILPIGLRAIFHGRIYELMEDISFPPRAKGMDKSTSFIVYGQFRLVGYI